MLFDLSTNQEITSLKVDLDLEIPSDRFEIGIKPGKKADSIKIGDPVLIALGYDQVIPQVMTGRVGSIEPTISDVKITGYSAVHTLTRIRANQVYEKQTAGQIIKDLAGIAGILPENIEDGITLPMYVINDTKDIYTHMRDLAIRCGFDLYLTPQGKIVFGKYSRKTPKKVKFGRDILQAVCEEPIILASTVRVLGESPASFKGGDTVHWLTKKTVEGRAGNGAVELLIEDTAVRDNDTAEKVATAYLERISVPLTGTVKTLGNARICLGDTLEMTDLHDSRMNGEFEVSSVHHTFEKTEGFITFIGWMKRISISPTAPPLPEAAFVIPPQVSSPLEDELRLAEVSSERAAMRLQDEVEEGELALEESQIAINSSMAKIDKSGNDFIEEAVKVRNSTFEEASKLADSKIDGAKKKALVMEKEADSNLMQVRKKVDEEKAKVFEKIEEVKKSYAKTRETVLNAKELLGI